MFPFERDEESGVPLWVQLRNRIVYLIGSGYYHAGDQLPTTHELAVDVGINYNTVNKVYTSLAHDGYITSKRGVGAFVNALEPDVGAEQADAIREVLDECVAALSDLGLSRDDIERSMKMYLRKLEQERG